MAQGLAYNTLDVFSSRPFHGNPLGLVHIPYGLSLSQEQKQKIAIEFNYSETVLLYERAPNAPPATYDAQIFTPKSELPFAGHPTIGTAFWIFQNLEKDRDDITINLRAGPVKARFDRVKVQASAFIPHNVRVHLQQIPWKRVVASQPGLARASPDWGRSSWPICSVVPGMNFVLVDLSLQPELLNEIIVTKNDIPKVSDLDKGWPDGLMGNVFYTLEPDRQDGLQRLKQRVIVIDLEDPATGAASAALAAYITLKRGEPGKQYAFRHEQGIEMDRSSTIHVDVWLKPKDVGIDKIELCGNAVEVMSGKMSF